MAMGAIDRQILAIFLQGKNSKMLCGDVFTPNDLEGLPQYLLLYLSTAPLRDFLSRLAES